MKREFSQSVIHVSLCINYDRGEGAGNAFLSTCNGDKIQGFFFCLQQLEKFSDIDLVVFVVENADEVRLIYFS